MTDKTKKEETQETKQEVPSYGTGKARLENVLMRLYNGKDDRFYANLFHRIDRVQSNQCPTMGVGVVNGRLQLVYNTNFLDRLDNNEASVILKHEAMHLINQHLQRGKGAKEKDMVKHRMENISMDCAINQYLDQDVIKKIGGVTLEKFRSLLTHKDDKFVLQPKQSFEYYQKLLEQEKEHREQQQSENGDKGQGQPSFGDQLGDMEMDDHGLFGNLDELGKAMLEEKIKQAYHATGAGKCPSEVEELMKLMRKPVVNWKRELKQFIGQGIRADKKTSRSRRNRRYGIDFAGHKRDHVARILVVLDTSGSMYGSRTDKVLQELYGIWKNNPNSTLDIVECDAKIQSVFTYKGKEELKITGRGGTNITPALDYAQQNKYDGVIVLTDGEFWETFKQYKIRSLWIIAQNRGYKSPIGKTIHLD